MGTRCALSIDDLPVFELLEELWEPFVVDGGHPVPLTIEISREGSGWVVTSDGTTSSVTDVWQVTETTRRTMLVPAIEDPAAPAVLHAGVVANDAGALLLVGGPGVGKTSLTIALVERGWTYFSDDLAPIDRGPRVLPFPKPLSIKDVASWPRFRDAWGAPSWLPSPIEMFFIPPAVVGTVASVPAMPKAVVFPRLDASSYGSLEQMTTAEAMTRCGPFISRMDRERLQILESACRTGDCFRMEYPGLDAGVELLSSIAG